MSGPIFAELQELEARSPQERLLRMRAEWLKVKGYLLDPITGLPALPAVVEEVRRRIDHGKSVGLVYLDLQSEEQLEEIYGWETYDGLIQQVASILREAVGESDLVALRGVRSDEFILFLDVPRGGGSGDGELVRLRDKLVHGVASRLQVQVGTEGPRSLGIHCASQMLRHDPTMRIERTIYRGVDELKTRCRRERDLAQTSRLNELRRILASGDVRVRYQPILWLSDAQIFGYEALSGGPEGALFEDSEMLFSFAEKTDQIRDLERLCRLQAVRGAARLPRQRKLFINCSVHSIEDSEFFSGPFLEHADAAGLTARDMVLEITERVAVTSWSSFRTRLAGLRRQGFSVAIDDMGAGYSSLQTVAEIEPDYLKLDISLVRDIHRSPIKRDLLESLAALGRKIGAETIAEGVEKEAEFELLRDMKISYGQGFFFTPPGTIPRFDPNLP